jgi:hypothetical protein
MVLVIEPQIRAIFAESEVTRCRHVLRFSETIELLDHLIQNLIFSLADMISQTNGSFEHKDKRSMCIEAA